MGMTDAARLAEELRAEQDVAAGFVKWNLRLMLNNAEWVMPPRISASLKDASRRCLMLLMRTGRIKTVCKNLLMTCKTKSSHTRNKLRRQKKLQLSTCQSSAMPKHKPLNLLSLLM